MFTFEGVIALFRSKSDAWVVGIWTELCTLFIVASLWLVIDAEKRRLSLHIVVLLVAVGFFLAGAGFALYVVIVAFCSLKGARHKDALRDASEVLK